jgi:serine/threonine protein kinase
MRNEQVARVFSAVEAETPASVRSRARDLSARYMADHGDADGFPLAAGDPAGPFEILEVLGSGGQAVVYKARHRQINRLVALKVPRREVGDRLLKEASMTASLEHASIARVEDVHLDGPVPYLVMELCEGGSLEDLLDGRSEGLDLGQVREIATAVLTALAFAHDHGVVHRDVKPANILFDREGRAKVGDFGIGTHSATDSLSVSMDVSQRTLLAGTPLYLAPEQEDPSLRVDGRLDGRADLFAFGKVLFQMLTAASPRTVRPPSRLRQGLETAWDDYVFKLTEERPERRFAKAREALAAMPGSAPEVAVVRAPAPRAGSDPASIDRLIANIQALAPSDPRRKNFEVYVRSMHEVSARAGLGIPRIEAVTATPSAEGAIPAPPMAAPTTPVGPAAAERARAALVSKVLAGILAVVGWLVFALTVAHSARHDEPASYAAILGISFLVAILEALALGRRAQRAAVPSAAAVVCGALGGTIIFVGIALGILSAAGFFRGDGIGVVLFAVVPMIALGSLAEWLANRALLPPPPALLPFDPRAKGMRGFFAFVSILGAIASLAAMCWHLADHLAQARMGDTPLEVIKGLAFEDSLLVTLSLLLTLLALRLWRSAR